MSDAFDSVQATYDAATGSVRGFLQPQSYGRKVKLMSISGPTNSQLTIYRGHVPGIAGQITNLFPADVRTYTADGPEGSIDLIKGAAHIFVWTRGNVAAGQTAAASFTSEVY